MIKFKTSEVQREYEGQRLDPKVKEIIDRLDAFCVANGFPEVYITDIIREDQMSQHYYGEAFDMRLRNIEADGSRSDRYTLEQFAKILDFLEVYFPRSDRMSSGRRARTAYAHGNGDNLHIHVSIDHKK